MGDMKKTRSLYHKIITNVLLVTMSATTFFFQPNFRNPFLLKSVAAEPLLSQKDDKNRFLSTSGHNYIMAKVKNSTEIEPMKFFSEDELKEAAKKLIEANNVSSAILNYSIYQRGQLAFYFIYEFYKLGVKDVNERQKSDRGKKIYSILSELYKFKENKYFKGGYQDENNKNIIEEDIEGFFEAMKKYKNYKKYLEMQGVKEENIILFINFLLEGYDRYQNADNPEALAEYVKTQQALKSTPIKKIPEDIINEFISSFGVVVSPTETYESKIEKLEEKFKELLSVENAIDVTKAVLYACYILDEDKRKDFINWLSKIVTDNAQKRKLVDVVISSKGTTTTPAEKVKEMFEQSISEEKIERPKKEEDLENLKKSYPKVVRDYGSQTFIASLENGPTGEAMENLIKRVEYITKQKEILTKYLDQKSKDKVKEIDREIKYVEDWLSKFDLKSETIEKKLEELKNGMVLIQKEYLSLAKKEKSEVVLNLALFNYLDNPNINNNLKKFYKQYLLYLDKNIGKLFVDLKNLDSEDSIKEAKGRVKSFFDGNKHKEAQQIWMGQYSNRWSFPQVEADGKIKSRKPSAEISAAERLASDFEKDAFLSHAFYEYQKKVQENGVITGKETELEANLVASTAIRLAGLHPTLVIKYFNALANLAVICEGNPDAFIRALESIKARVDAVTDPIYSETSAFQIAPPSIRIMINRLSSAFDSISDLDKNTIVQYNRYDLIDNNIYISPLAPHPITQKPPRYKYNLTEGRDTVGYFTPSYPFPLYLDTVPRGDVLITGGGINSYGQYGYGGNIILPRFNLYFLSTGTKEVELSVKNYLYPGHPVIGIPEYLPGTYITLLSATELLNEINKAFISTQPLGYEGEIIGGGGGAGVMGRRPAEEWQFGGGALGSVLTPTGGVAFGGSYVEGEKKFGGINAVALPVGKVKVGALGEKGEEKEIGIESSSIGYEKLDDGTKKLLISSITNAWDPKNPSDLIITVNREERITTEKEEKAWMNHRLFYIDKNGTIYEITAGVNDFVDMLNYVAGYTDKTYGLPFTGAYNVEPGIERGGAALAFDIGKTSWLIHVQAVPFISPDISGDLKTYTDKINEAEKKMAAAKDAAKRINELVTDAKDAEKRINELLDPKNPDSLPALIKERENAIREKQKLEEEYKEAKTDKEKAQVRKKILIVDKKIAELDKDIPIKKKEIEDEIENAKQTIDTYTRRKLDLMASGGQPLLLEWTPAFSTTKEEGSKTNVFEFVLPGKRLEITRAGLEEKAVVQDVVFTWRQVEGKNARELTIGGGVGTYSELIGDAKSPTDKLIAQGGIFYKVRAPKSSWGAGVSFEGGPTDLEAMALLQDAEESRRYIENLYKLGFTLYGSKEMANNLLLGALAHIMPTFTKEEGKDVEWSHTFWRFIAFLKGAESAAKIDLSRVPGFEEMLIDYNKMLANINNDPANVANYTTQFKQKYEAAAKQLFNNYYLGVQINRDFSLEISAVAKEKEKSWASQWPPELVQGRALYTWDTGFWRMFVALPTWGGPVAAQTGSFEKIGIVGTGVGFDLFKGLWLQRMAFDIGVLVAMEEDEVGSVKKLKDPSMFVQGAVKLYSDVLEDADEYRKLKANYERYREMITRNELGAIPADVRKEIIAKCDKTSFTQKLLEKLENGEKAVITDEQKNKLYDALWEWFYDKKTELSEKFSGKMNAYLAASGYFIGADRKMYWDIGGFVEYVDRMKAYLILAKREKPGLYGGFDFSIRSVTIGLSGWVAEKDRFGAISVKKKWGPGYVVGYGYFRSSAAENYAWPGYPNLGKIKGEGWPPGFVFFIFYNIGPEPYPSIPYQPTSDYSRFERGRGR